MAFGNVYVFNLFMEPLDIHPNGARAGIVQAWSGGPRFQLAAPLEVPRTRHASEATGRFANETNYVRLLWDSFEATAEIAIAGEGIAPANDVLLFVALNRWRLVLDRGYEIASGEVRRWG